MNVISSLPFWGLCLLSLPYSPEGDAGGPSLWQWLPLQPRLHQVAGGLLPGLSDAPSAAVFRGWEAAVAGAGMDSARGRSKR